MVLVYSLLLAVIGFVASRSLLQDPSRWEVDIGKVILVKPFVITPGMSQSLGIQMLKSKHLVPRPPNKPAPKSKKEKDQSQESSSSSQNIKDEKRFPTKSPKKEYEQKHPYLSKFLQFFSNFEKNQVIQKSTGSLD